MKRSNLMSMSVKPAYLYLLYGIAGLTFSLIVFGVILRVKSAGELCPDWPVCSEAWPLSFETPVFYPFIHRILAGLSGLSILAATIIAWLNYRDFPWLKILMTLSVAVIAFQILIGRSMVLGSTFSGLSALHFFMGLLSMACIIPALMISQILYTNQTRRSQIVLHFSFSSPIARLSLWTLASIMFMLILGVGVSATGARSACLGWPLCSGFALPENPLSWLNLIHRGTSLISGVFLLILIKEAWRTQRRNTAVIVATSAAGALFASQALMGIVEITQQYPDYLLGLHTATAISVWIVMVIQLTLVGIAGEDSDDLLKDSTYEPPRQIGRLIRDYLMLTKPVVVALLLVTTFAGMVVGAHSWPSLSLTLWTMIAGFLAAGGSGAINQYIDRYDDIKMQRTSNRPIPSGRLTPGEGLAFGVAATIVAFYLMVAMVNFLAGVLTLAGAVYYVVIYSIILKKTTVQNIVIGGGAGAIPPLVGWAAATGSLNIPSLFLFAVVFMWTPPHFWALALVRKVDYARAGVPMLPVVRGEKETRWQIFLYTMELVALTLVLPLFGLGSGIYFVFASFLGAFILHSAWKVWRGEGNKVAWKMYRHSSMYLAFLFLALMVDALI